MQINKLIFILITLFLSSCSLIFKPAQEQTLDELFNDGWEFYVYNGDLVLKKETSSGVVIKDYFNKLGDK